MNEINVNGQIKKLNVCEQLYFKQQCISVSVCIFSSYFIGFQTRIISILNKSYSDLELFSRSLILKQSAGSTFQNIDSPILNFCVESKRSVVRS